MFDPVLFVFVLFHAWEHIAFAWQWWKGTDPTKKTFVKAEVYEEKREPALLVH